MKPPCEWPDANPPECIRGCTKLLEAHTQYLSIALYASSTIMQDKICAYSFCCGHDEIYHHTVKEGETLKDTANIVIAESVKLHIVDAIKERADFGPEEPCMRM